MFSNPFTDRRKKKEDAIADKYAQLQAAQQQQQQQASSFGNPNAMVAAPIPAMDLMLDPSDSKASTADPYASEDFSKYLPASAQVEQSAPSWTGGQATYEAPSRARQCFGKLQSGFMIGASLGGAFGTRAMSPKR